MGMINDLDRLSSIVANLTAGDNPDRLLPLIRQIDLMGLRENPESVVKHLVKARGHMDKMVKAGKITTRGLTWTVDNLMSAMFKYRDSL